MRVEKRESRPTISKPVRVSDGVSHRRVVETTKESFEQLLQSEEHANLQSMLEEVVRLGDQLAEKRTLQDLELYKSAVRRFVHYATNRAFRLRRTRTISGGWYQLVETIDGVLADLTEMILTREIPRITLLAKLEMIQGLLVDCLR